MFWKALGTLLGTVRGCEALLLERSAQLRLAHGNGRGILSAEYAVITFARSSVDFHSSACPLARVFGYSPLDASSLCGPLASA